MKTSIKNNRRQFLKNTSLAALNIGLISKFASGATKEHQKIRNKAICESTTQDYYGEGPFYSENPPLMTNNILAQPTEPGQRIIISGRIHNLDCSQVLPETKIDVWHANSAGQYDNNSYNLRGITYSNRQGFYIFETIMPGNYPNGGSYRPSHIHFKITPLNSDTLITQLYFEGDEFIDSDAAASITEGEFNAAQRIISLKENPDGKLEGTWDITLDGVGNILSNEIHLNKGMIYTIGPNPFSTEIVINYGVFKNAKVSLLVFDIHGRLIANLEEKNLLPEKYTAIWNPDTSLPAGHYFIALKINDLQVHYKKIIKQ